ncbi:hypothetical protein QR98_0089790 [Sarcoptes scabiei]|nr:hypothetical protein QR98_0089790 [Sarcoptes scabiei]
MINPEWNLITSKLNSCLAVCVVLNIDSQWSNAIQDIVEFFKPEKLPNIPPTRVIQILLEIISFIPDAFNSNFIDKHKKIAVRTALIKHGESILSFVLKILSEENISDSIMVTCFKCFSSWSIGLDQLILANDCHSKITVSILNCAKNKNICHEAIESLISVYNDPRMFKQPNLVLCLIEQMTVVLQDTISKAIENNDHDLLKDLYNIFVSVGECHINLILDSLSETSDNIFVMSFFQIILKCSHTPTYYGYDESISDMAFNFWIRFLDELLAAEENRTHLYLKIFDEVLHSLINIFMFKLQYPPKEIYEDIWDEEDQEKFRCYRQDIADAYAFCSSVIHKTLLAISYEHFNKAFTQLIMAANKENDPQLIDSNVRYLEATIYAFSTLTENLPTNEAIYMPQIISSIQTLPACSLDDSRLLSTINSFLSNASEWLSKNVNYIGFALNIINNSLESSNLFVVISASMALKVITSECQASLIPYAPQIVTMCEKYLKYPHLQYKEKARLMNSLGTVLSIMPLEVIMQTIDRVLIPILSETEKLLMIINNNHHTDGTTRSHINGVLLMLSNLFGNLDVNLKNTELEEGDEMVSKTIVEKKAKNNQPQPLYRIFEKILPAFGVIVMNFYFDEEIAQNLCECIKKTVTTLLDDIKPLLNNILELLFHLYDRSRSESVIKISRHIFTLFHSDTELLPRLQDYFEKIVRITIAAFESNFHDHTFLVQNFFEECAQILRKAKIIYSNPNLNLGSLFEWAISGMLLPEKGTTHQCSVFVTGFLNQGRHDERFHAVIMERFELLIRQIFIVITAQQGASLFAVDYIPPMIIMLNQKYCDSFNRALHYFVECNNFPTEKITKEEKEKFVQSITAARNSRLKLLEICQEFSSRCRGLYLIDKKR